jgi:hypothetical protein
MDVSKEYIEMCQKTKEIQDKELEDGDYFCLTTLFDRDSWEQHWWIEPCKVLIYHGYHHHSIIEEILPNLIFLPRQDQLQEMIKIGNDIGTLYRFYKWIALKSTKNMYQVLNTMEKLWLSFVMKEKYHKIWDGQEWKVEIKK